MQLILPFPSKSESPDAIYIPISRQIYGKGDKKNLYTDYRRIGDYVAQIIADERTINQYVIVWEEELTLEQAKTISEKASGEEEVLRAKRIPVRYRIPYMWHFLTVAYRSLRKSSQRMRDLERRRPCAHNRSWHS